MRLPTLLVILLATATISLMAATCPTNQSKEENTLVQAEQTWAKALEKHDSDVVSCLMAEEFQDTDSNGELHDRTQALAHIPQRPAYSNRLENVRARVYGDFAFVRGLNKVVDSSGKLLAQVRFTDMFVYRDGRWQAVAGQETLVTKKAP